MAVGTQKRNSFEFNGNLDKYRPRHRIFHVKCFYYHVKIHIFYRNIALIRNIQRRKLLPIFERQLGRYCRSVLKGVVQWSPEKLDLKFREIALIYSKCIIIIIYRSNMNIFKSILKHHLLLCKQYFDLKVERPLPCCM